MAQPVTAPSVITSPGVYELNADARGITDVYGIKIESSDVVLDGQSHFIGGDQRENSIGVYVNKYGGSITNVSIKNLKLEDWNSGIDYQYVKGQEGDTNEITNCDIIDCLTGIHIEYSDVVSIVDNLIRDCSTAINIEDDSTGVSITDNTIKGDGVGVVAINTVNVTLTGNNINTCTVYGVQVSDSSDFSIKKNTISDNKYAALQIENSKDSIITDNNFSKTETGPALVIGNEVRGAQITNNYFGSTTDVSVDDVSSDIVWNTTLTTGTNILGGPYLGGNYWGSAPGLNGFSDEVVDKDGFGIGDKPYEINSYNIDHLPLTHTDKNYPAPTPEPEEPAEAMGEVDAIPADNVTRVNISTENTTLENVTMARNESADLLQDMESLAEIPEAAMNLSEAVTDTFAVGDNPETLSSPVQNEYIPVEYPNITEPNVTRNVSPGDNQSEHGPAEPVGSSSKKNGYLLFTGIPADVRVILRTVANADIALDKVVTSTLSIPVPADYPYYSSWRLVGDNGTLSEGQISRYPAPDETVVIPVTTEIPSVTDNNPVAFNNSTQVAGLTPSIIPLDGYQANNSFIDQGVYPEKPLLSVPPVQPLPSSMTRGSQDGNGTVGPLVLVNGKSGDYETGFTITAYAGPGGAIFPEGTVNVKKGGDVTFVLTPYEGHTLDYLLIDGSNTKSEEEYAFVNVTGDHTIIAGFR